MRHQLMLQRDLQTVGQKRNQDVRVGAMFELMIDRADAQFALEGSKHRFDLRQLDVARPQHCGVFRGQIGAEQVVTVTQLRRVEFGLVDAEPERLARDRLAAGSGTSMWTKPKARPASVFAAPMRISS